MRAWPPRGRRKQNEGLKQTAAVNYNQRFNSPADDAHSAWKEGNIMPGRGGWFDRGQHLIEATLNQDYNTCELLAAHWYAGTNCQAVQAAREVMGHEPSAGSAAPH